MKKFKFVLTFISFFLAIILSIAQPGTRGASGLPNKEEAAAGTTYAVVIGISSYQHIPQLKYAHRDAKAFYDFLRSKSGGSVDSNHICLLLNEHATGAAIRNAISNWLIEEKKPQKGDVVFIYFAGHGDALNDEESYLLGWDQVDGNPEVVYDGGYNLDIIHLKKRVKKLTDAGVNVFLITDACRGKELPPGGEKGRSNMANSIMESKEGEIQFTSCSGGEVSVEDRAWGDGRGLFSYWLINGLYGLADKDKDGFVTVGELEEYVRDSVKSETSVKDKTTGKIVHMQNPFFCCSEYEGQTMFKVDSAKKMQVLADLNKQAGEGQMYASIDKGRGIDESHSTIPDTVKALYKTFQQHIEDEELMAPYYDCAYSNYFAMTSYKLPEDFSLKIKNELSVALVNEGQQVMNYYVSYKNTTPLKYSWRQYFSYAARCLDSARGLVGKDDDLYPVINRNRLIFDAAGYAHITDDFNSFDKAKMYYALAELDSAKAISKKPSAVINHTYAYIYTTLHDYPSSIKSDSEANIIAPDWSFPLNGLGSSYTTTRQYDKAEKCFLQALKLDSIFLNAIHNLGVLYEDEKKYDLSEKYFLRALRLDSGYTNSMYGLGKLYNEQKQYNKAEYYYMRAIRNDSTFTNAIYSLALQYKSLKKYARAETYYRMALRMDSLNTFAFIGLGNLFEEESNYPKAEEYYRKALKLDSTYTIALYNLGLVYKDQKKYEQAEYYYRKAYTCDSNYTFALYGLGSLYIDLKMYDEAEIYFRKDLKIDSTDANCWVSIGNLYEDRKDTQAAISYYQKTLDVDSAYYSASDGLAAIYDKQKDYKEAEYYYVKAARNDSTNPYPLTLAGNFYNEQKMNAQAEEYYLKAIKADSSYVYAYYTLAYFYQGQNNNQKALQYFNQLLKIDSTYIYGFVGAAASSKIDKDYEKSNQYLLKAFRLDSLNPSVLSALITVYDNYKETPQTIRYTKLLTKSVDTTNTPGLNYLGYATLYQREFATAEYYYNKVLALDSTSYISSYNLACAYSLESKTTEAIRLLDMSIRTGYKDFDHIGVDTDLDNIRKTPEFKAVMKKYFPDKVKE